jgi:hypothetical protein
VRGEGVKGEGVKGEGVKGEGQKVRREPRAVKSKMEEPASKLPLASYRPR